MNALALVPSGRPFATREHGAILLIVLIMLVMLTLVGVTSIRTATLEERMAGNSRDHDLAFQAAEAALRDAENDLQGLVLSGTPRAITPLSFPIASPGVCYTGADTALYGLCYVTDTTMELSDTSSRWSSATESVTYGAYTQAPALPGVAQPPRYMIELLPMKAKVTGISITTDYYYLRVTAMGYGANAGTRVRLQTIYVAPLSY